MLTRQKVFGIAALMAGVAVLCTSPVLAQQNWVLPHIESSVSVELSKVVFEPNNPSTSFGSSTIFVSARIPVSDYVYLLADVPFAFVDRSLTTIYNEDATFTVFDEAQQSMFGNPFLGAQIEPAGVPVYFLTGIRLPLAPDDQPLAAAYGQAADLGRFDAFTPNETSLRGRIGYINEFQSHTEMHLWGGSILQIPRRINDPKNFYLDYGAQLQFRYQSIRIAFGVAGVMLYSGRDLEFQRRLVNQFGVTLNYGSGRWRPGIHLRTPMSDQLGLEQTNYVFGINLSIRLGEAY